MLSGLGTQYRWPPQACHLAMRPRRTSGTIRELVADSRACCVHNQEFWPLLKARVQGLETLQV